MTTTTPTTPTDTLARLKYELDSMLSPLDVPGDWTKRRKDAYELRRARLQQYVTNWPAWTLDKPTKRRAVVRPAFDMLKAAEQEIDTQLSALPDKTIPESAQRNESARQNALIAAKTALHVGVQYFDGHPVLPEPLRALLTPPPCGTCHRPYDVAWHGPIDVFEAELKQLDKEIADAEASVSRHAESAERLLAIPLAP